MGKLKYLTVCGLVVVIMVGPNLLSTESTGTACNSLIAVDSLGNVHVIWEDDSDFTGTFGWSNIVYKTMNEGSWTNLEVLSTLKLDDAVKHSVWALCLSVDDHDNVHAVWQQNSWDGNDNYTSHIVHMIKNGSGWNEPEVYRITYGNWVAATIDSNGGLHAIILTHILNESFIIIDKTLSYVFKHNDNWSLVSQQSWNRTFSEPVLRVDDENVVHLVYVGDMPPPSTQFGLVHVSYDNGEWSEPFLISTESRDAAIASFAGDLHVVWCQNVLIEDYWETDVFYRALVNGDWTSLEHVSIESNKDSMNPAIAIDAQGGVHIVWSDKMNLGPAKDNEHNIFYKSKLDGEWSDVQPVSDTGGCYRSTIAVDSLGNIHSTWEGPGLHGPGIYYNCKQIGETWV